MNKSFSKIRHIQETNKRLDSRIISEQSPNAVSPTNNILVAAEACAKENNLKKVQDFVTKIKSGDKDALMLDILVMNVVQDGNLFKELQTLIPCVLKKNPSMIENFKSNMPVFEKMFSQMGISLKDVMKGVSPDVLNKYGVPGL